MCAPPKEFLPHSSSSCYHYTMKHGVAAGSKRRDKRRPATTPPRKYVSSPGKGITPRQKNPQKKRRTWHQSLTNLHSFSQIRIFVIGRFPFPCRLRGRNEGGTKKRRHFTANTRKARRAVREDGRRRGRRSRHEEKWRKAEGLLGGEGIASACCRIAYVCRIARQGMLFFSLSRVFSCGWRDKRCHW